MKSNSEYIWYKLLKTKGVGPKTIHNIYNNCKNKSRENSGLNENDVNEFLKKNKKLLTNWENVNDEICFLEYEKVLKKDIKILTLDSKNYPKIILNNIGATAAPILFCGGKIDLLNNSGIAVVGSRNVCDNGIKFTKNISKQLSNSGFNIISGYAKGVDTISHLSALENDGTTTFVLSYGLYEFKKKKDFKDIKWTGNILALSEFLPDSQWTASNAMIRNKTIIGLSNAVIVVQSGPEKDEKGNMSGTFNSGNLALKNNIPLFVLTPSFVDNSLGNKNLIGLGGIEITPDNAIEKIKEHLSKTVLKENKDSQTNFNFD